MMQAPHMTMALALMLAPALPLHAQTQFGTGTVMEAVQKLKPGQFIWAPDVAPEGPVLLVVSLATQRAVLYRNGVPIAISTVSTGKAGHDTPTGVFTVLQKQVEHYSNLYDNAPMPYMQRLTWGGVALHGGNLPGYPASHGCIRLPQEFAKKLYGVTRLGMTVVITEEAGVPKLAPAGDPADAGFAPGPADAEVTWRPEVASSGPVSIVISAADRRVVVLRNGKVIGSAPVAFGEPVQGTTAYVLRGGAGQPAQWMSVALGGSAAGEPVPQGFWQRFEVDDAFRKAVAGIVAPGTTIVLTADTLDRENEIDKQRTVIEVEPNG